MFRRDGKFEKGWVEVITGCMYSGKTEELIRRVRRAEFAHLKYQVFKPLIDNRYSPNHVASHSQKKLQSTVVETAYEIMDYLKDDTRVVGIDEAQFFGNELIPIVDHLANRGLRAIVAGLDTDWRGEPFSPIPELMATAEVVEKLYAICIQCGNTGTRTQRLTSSQDNIVVGAKGVYEARCRSCFVPPQLDASFASEPSRPQFDEIPL